MDKSRLLEKYINDVSSLSPNSYEGMVVSVKGFVVSAKIPVSEMGSICEITPLVSKEKIYCEVIGFDDEIVYLMAFSSLRGVSHGAKVKLVNFEPKVKLSNQLLGRVIDSLGQPLDGKGPIEAHEQSSLYKLPPNPMDREPIDEVLGVGVNAIDGFTTIGKGQRVAFMAGSGVGKSVLLGMMAKLFLIHI